MFYIYLCSWIKHSQKLSYILEWNKKEIYYKNKDVFDRDKEENKYMEKKNKKGDATWKINSLK